MQKAKNGDTVRVHYTGKLKDGNVFDTSVRREPLEFTLGESKVIRGVQEAVAGMAVGESKTIQVPPDKAYGAHRRDQVFEVVRGELPATVEPEVGQRFEYRQPDGPAIPLTVTEVTEETVTLDGNHPLAGKELTFDLELVGIVEGGAQA
ncbi:MAG: peptidylprolyl isomerase [Gemmatimonadetes bacterium]|nr:peptidylprolyl isomerase [Gemmatimonadota bacterium]